MRLYLVSNERDAEMMLALSDLAAALGLSAKSSEAQSPVALIFRIEHGLPVKSLDKVAHLLAPDDGQFKYRLVPKATLERRKTTNKLSPQEGARLARLAKVWAAARDVWRSDDEARDFLFRRNLLADDNRPIDLVIQSEFGAELILDILGHLKYGTAI
jgi:putative toxin-antitoxin system antitoxin component (TIGR02293 family)